MRRRITEINARQAAGKQTLTYTRYKPHVYTQARGILLHTGGNVCFCLWLYLPQARDLASLRCDGLVWYTLLFCLLLFLYYIHMQQMLYLNGCSRIISLYYKGIVEVILSVVKVVFAILWRNGFMLLVTA